MKTKAFEKSEALIFYQNTTILLLSLIFIPIFHYQTEVLVWREIRGSLYFLIIYWKISFPRYRVKIVNYKDHNSKKITYKSA